MGKLSAFLLIACIIVSTDSAFAQGDRGTITGTVTDPTGLVVANAMIEARNTQTGATYDTASTSTGNYTLSQLPAGTYDLVVNVSGFKKYVRQGITVQVAAVDRIDVTLEVGSANESVNVTGEASLLKTESGEMSHNVNTERLDDLPIQGIGAAQSGSSGIRNPNAVTQLIPGTYYVPNSVVRVNGAPGNTESYRVEGMDASNAYVPATPAQTQPSVDAIQEITIQTSNFAPEYGQVGGGFFNVTMRSGTNALHGSAYDYWVNEVLNANTPFINQSQRPRQRRNDYGGTLGGPVILPKIYNGRNKTFFFFNFEQFRETQLVNSTFQTVPTAAYRTGDFSGAIAATGSTKIGTDPLGRAVLENEIYNPATTRTMTIGGQSYVVRDPFANNTIPTSMMDPVALKVQNMIPAPNLSGAFNNYLPSFDSTRVTTIPAVKIDQQLNSQQHLSFYWSETKTTSPYSATYGAANGLPEPITTAIGTYITSHIERLNYDNSLTPTLLLHLGAGFQQDYFDTDAKTLDYNASQELGLNGATIPRNFPQFTGLMTTGNAGGGMVNMGPVGQNHNYYQKPTFNASMTWVRGSHTFKAGGEARIEGYPASIFTNANGSYAFSPNETGPAYNNGQSLSGILPGFAYASFLLGNVDSVNISNPVVLRLGKKEFGAFVQDSWKISRKLTLDYGVRYDYSTYLKEQYGRYPNFSPSTPNPNAGGLPGAVIFEGYGNGRCNCEFAHNYPFAIGPRLGLAYQIDPKTVFRAGWGVVYSGTEDANGATQTVNISQPVASAGFGQAVMTLAGGIPAAYAPAPWPSFNNGQYVKAGVISTPPAFIDQNAGRPARQMQWSIGLQRQLTPSFLVEASWVGNRGVWWQAPAETDVNALTPQILAAHGLSLSNPADITLLTSSVSSSLAAQRGFNLTPYAGFPTSSTVAQALRPFPQFGSIISWWSPDGDTWYNSMQAKATKRMSHNLQFISTFTWQKSLTNGTEVNPIAQTLGGASVNDFQNRSLNKFLSQYDQPFIYNISLTYATPKLNINKFASWILRDWSYGVFLQYASGLPIHVPYATNNLNQVLLRNNTTGVTGVSTVQGTYADRVPGQPLFTEDLNCNCFDPNKTFVLNPAAWVNPPAGQFGTSAAYYNDYRYERHPIENMNLGRTFRIHERVTLNVRAEFDNIFNRAYINNPTGVNASATQTKNAATGLNNGGFGYINSSVSLLTYNGQPRNGSIVARITF